MYDAVADAVPLADSGRHTKKALLVISDGNDTNSQISVRELRQQIRESEVLVYALGVDGTASVPRNGPAVRLPIPLPFPVPGRGGQRPLPPIIGGGGTRARVAGDRGADVTAALVELATDDDCELAMTAAAALADRGDRSYLPRRPDPDDQAALIRALCLSAHDPDKARAARLFSALVARDATLTTEQYAEAEDNDEGDGRSSEESRLTAADAAVFDGPLGDCELHGECLVGESGTTAWFTTSRQGKLVVAGVRRKVHIYCGCELIEFGAR